MLFRLKTDSQTTENNTVYSYSTQKEAVYNNRLFHMILLLILLC